MYKPGSVWQWSFFLVAVVQALAALALEGYVFGLFQSSLTEDAEIPGSPTRSVARSIPTYLSLLIFGFLYQLVLVYDALMNQNTIQVIGLCLYNVGILVYTAIQIGQINDAVSALLAANHLIPSRLNLWADLKAYLVAVPCVIGLGTALLSIIAWKLYEEFAWNIYKQISADLRLKRRYLIYQIYIAILKFDFFLFLGFEVQFLVIVSDTTDLENYLTIASVPVTIVLLLIAAYSTKKENVYGMVFTIIVYFGALAYFLFKLVRMYYADANRRKDYLPARRTLTVFALITIILLLVTIYIAIWCTRNFGKGLKPHLNGGNGRFSKKRGHKAALSGSADGSYAYTPDKMYLDNMPHSEYNTGPHYGAGSRMTID